MKNLICLGIGVLLTIILLVFPAYIYEVLYSPTEFANEMYNNDCYFMVALITAIAAWGAASVFYYVINSVRFSRWYNWLTVLGVLVVIIPVVNFFYLDGVFYELGMDFTHEEVNFSISSIAIVAVMYVIASFSIRWWSSNCRHTPIPE